MLRAFSRRLFERVNVRGVKTSTGIVGLPADPNARQTLTQNLLQVKELIAQQVPETAYYRTIVDADVEEKLKTLKENESDEAVEEIFGFQLEQVIAMTEEEMKLIPFLAEHKPWDVPEGHEEKSFSGHDPYETGFWEGPPGAATKDSGPQATPTS